VQLDLEVRGEVVIDIACHAAVSDVGVNLTEMDDLVVEIPNQIAGLRLHPYREPRDWYPRTRKWLGHLPRSGCRHWRLRRARRCRAADEGINALLADEDVVAVAAPATTSEELAFCDPPSS
jgi:hypothetical protein